MAIFRHRYAGLTLQDDKGIWAQFEPQSEVDGDGREVRYGLLETDDTAQVKRLREAAKNDKDLVEVKGNQADESK